jgi:hypothetical protein
VQRTAADLRILVACGGSMLAVSVAACGGGGGTAKVGACIDANNKVVDCSSSQAKQRLVSDQSAANAIACVAIGDKPQVTVRVAGHPYCAESK